MCRDNLVINSLNVLWQSAQCTFAKQKINLFQAKPSRLFESKPDRGNGNEDVEAYEDEVESVRYIAETLRIVSQTRR